MKKKGQFKNNLRRLAPFALLAMPFAHLSTRVGSSRRRPQTAYIEEVSSAAPPVSIDPFSSFSGNQPGSSARPAEQSTTDQEVLKFLKSNQLLTSSKVQSSQVQGGGRSFSAFCVTGNFGASQCASYGYFWDNIAPAIVAAPTITNVTATGFDLTFSLNEAGIGYYIVVPAAALVPSSLEVKSGVNYRGVVVAASGQLTMNVASTAATVTVTGLTTGVSYQVYVVGEDILPWASSYGISANLAYSVSSASATPADVTPPVLTSSAANAVDTGFDLLSKSNELGKGFYVLLASGSANPTAVEVQAGTGSGGAAALQFGSFNFIALNTNVTTAITGLTSGTAYDLWVVGEDVATNLQLNPTYISVITPDTLPPVTTAVTSNITQTSFDLSVTADEPSYVHYVVLDSGALAPTSAEVLTGTGAAGSTPVASNFYYVDIPGQTFGSTITGFTQGTSYDVYVAAQDLWGNSQGTPALIQWTAASPVVVTPTVVTPTNQAPSEALLIAPLDFDVVDNPAMLVWEKSTDPDGDPVTHEVTICDNPDFIGCSPQKVP